MKLTLLRALNARPALMRTSHPVGPELLKRCCYLTTNNVAALVSARPLFQYATVALPARCFGLYLQKISDEDV